MNQNIFKPLLVLFLCFFLIGTSNSIQAQSPKKIKKMLVGKWKIDIGQFKKNVIEKTKEKDEDMFNMLVSIMKKVRLEMQKGGKLIMTSPEKIQEGKWTLSKDGRTLSFIEDGEEEERQFIKSISKKSLVLEVSDESIGVLHLLRTED